MNQAQGDRPAVLESVSTTQMDELERQFTEGDRQGWSRLAQEYGWSDEQAQQVWDWFGQRPPRQ